jgi:16S rRNA processing protein rimM
VSHDTADIIVGRIVGVHGIRGQVKVYSDCRPRESLFQYRRFIARSEGRPELQLQLLRGQAAGKGLIAAFHGINDRDQAMTLSGYTLSIRREQLPPTRNGEYYWADLIGLRVENRQGITLGRVAELFETGSNDVLVVRADDTNEEILIPFIRPHYIENIDLTGGVMQVDWEPQWSQVTEDDR